MSDRVTVWESLFTQTWTALLCPLLFPKAIQSGTVRSLHNVHQKKGNENKLIFWGSSILTETKTPPLIIHHLWPPSFHIGTRPEAGWPDSSCQKDLRFHSQISFQRRNSLCPSDLTQTHYSKCNSCWLRTSGTSPRGITVRGVGLLFYVSYIVRVKVNVPYWT